jgi:hypothetical protein
VASLCLTIILLAYWALVPYLMVVDDEKAVKKLLVFAEKKGKLLNFVTDL